MVKESENRVAELMKERGVSLRDLAVELDVTEDTARRLEKRIPTKYLAALVAFFDCTSDHLLGLDRQPTSTEQVRKAVA